MGAGVPLRWPHYNADDFCFFSSSALITAVDLDETGERSGAPALSAFTDRSALILGGWNGQD
jgi:hypothetical protein